MYLFEHILVEQEEEKYYDLLPAFGKKNTETGLVDANVSFIQQRRNLTKLPYNFGFINGDFDIDQNLLTSLNGAPKKINGYFSCSENRISTIEFISEGIRSFFACSHNNIQSFDGLKYPNFFEYDFFCGNNPLTSLKGIPPITGHLNLENLEILSTKYLPVSCRNYDKLHREIRKRQIAFLEKLGYKENSKAFIAMIKALDEENA